MQNIFLCFYYFVSNTLKKIKQGKQDIGSNPIQKSTHPLQISPKRWLLPSKTRPQSRITGLCFFLHYFSQGLSILSLLVLLCPLCLLVGGLMWLMVFERLLVLLLCSLPNRLKKLTIKILNYLKKIREPQQQQQQQQQQQKTYKGLLIRSDKL
jgi:sensor histidine kinase YesM